MLKNETCLPLFLILILIIIPGTIYSQESGFLDGKILNSISLQPVPFATIKLKYKQLGVYANSDGDFKIMKDQEFTSDSVIITCIGYRRLSLAYKDFDKNKVNSIRLVPVTYGITEVRVVASGKKLGSREIIRRAIKNINDNYPIKPFNYISYYRDYQKRNGNYINLNEGIIQVLDNGFDKKSIKNKYRLLDYRTNENFPRLNISPYYTNSDNDSIKFIPEASLGDQYGNELFILMVHDAIRNYNTRSFSLIEIFSEDFLKNHNFNPPEPVYDNNQLLFKITFYGKSYLTENSLLIKGAIYIKPRTYAIHKIEYTCSYKTKKNSGQMFNVDIEYGQENSVDSLMCLKYISFNNFFKVVDRDDSTFFKSKIAYLDTEHYTDPTLVVYFNNDIDRASATDKNNYKIISQEKTLKIKNIQPAKRTVFIRLFADEIKNPSAEYQIEINDVKDINGNIINKRKVIDLFQYRELFVEEYNKPPAFIDSCFIQYMPLDQNCRSVYNGKEKYWMNTPFEISTLEP